MRLRGLLVLALVLGWQFSLQAQAGLYELLEGDTRLATIEAYASSGEYILEDFLGLVQVPRDSTLSSILRDLPVLRLPDSGPDKELILHAQLEGPELFLRLALSEGPARLLGVLLSERLASGLGLQRLFDWDLSLMETRVQRFDADGRIYELRRMDADGTLLQTLTYLWEDGVLKEERSWTPERQEIRSFGPDGRLARSQASGNGPREEVERIYSSSGALIGLRISYPDSQPPALTELDYDARGRVREQKEYRNGEILSLKSYTYEGESDRVLELRTETPGQVDLEVSVYEEGILVRREYTRNGQITQLSSYNGSTQVLSLYRAGREVLRLYYDNEIKVREEEILNGRVLRSREFSSGEVQ